MLHIKSKVFSNLFKEDMDYWIKLAVKALTFHMKQWYKQPVKHHCKKLLLGSDGRAGRTQLTNDALNRYSKITGENYCNSNQTLPCNVVFLKPLSVPTLPRLKPLSASFETCRASSHLTSAPTMTRVCLEMYAACVPTRASNCLKSAGP